jgi:hypothetical protein
LSRASLVDDDDDDDDDEGFGLHDRESPPPPTLGNYVEAGHSGDADKGSIYARASPSPAVSGLVNGPTAAGIKHSLEAAHECIYERASSPDWLSVHVPDEGSGDGASKRGEHGAESENEYTIIGGADGGADDEPSYARACPGDANANADVYDNLYVCGAHSSLQRTERGSFRLRTLANDDEATSNSSEATYERATGPTSTDERGSGPTYERAQGSFRLNPLVNDDNT